MTGRATRLRAALEELGPTFIKLGQFMSRRPDLLPAPYITELSSLQEATPPVPFPLVRNRLEEVCICRHRAGGHDPRAACLHCRGIDGVFESFDMTPVASASLAQVHRAVYQGKAVAVKLLKPGVLDSMNADLALLTRLRCLLGRALGVSRNVSPGPLEIPRRDQARVHAGGVRGLSPRAKAASDSFTKNWLEQSELHQRNAAECFGAGRALDTIGVEDVQRCGAPLAIFLFTGMSDGPQRVADLLVLVPGPHAVLAIGALACAAPTRRALRISPTEALRDR